MESALLAARRCQNDGCNNLTDNTYCSTLCRGRHWEAVRLDIEDRNESRREYDPTGYDKPLKKPDWWFEKKKEDCAKCVHIGKTRSTWDIRFCAKACRKLGQWITFDDE